MPRLAALLAAAIAQLACPPAIAATVQRDLSYVFMMGDRAAARQRSLDLFLPDRRPGLRPPLVAFVHGGLWRESDDRNGFGNALAQALLPANVAVALVRYPLAPAYRHPTQPEHVARAIAFLHRVADTHGYDPRRIFVLGHSAGAQLASLVALDARFLREAGAPADAVAGVIGVSGIYDLTPTGAVAGPVGAQLALVFGTDAATLRAASPMSHARRAPPFLILAAEKDFDGFQPESRRFGARLRAAGNKDVQQVVIKDKDHFSILNIGGGRNFAGDLILEFVARQPLPPAVDALMRARRAWQEPVVSTEPFWQHKDLIHAHPIDDRFRLALRRIYEYNAHELRDYALKTFHAIDLMSLLERLPRERIGNGDFLTVTNTRQEKEFWRLSDLAPYQPVVVVGVDDERNLFRLSVFYQGKREYSWRETPPPSLSVRSVGAFIYFLKPPPARLTPPRTVTYSLTLDSFRRSARDPLAAMANLPPEVYEVMHVRNGCFSCHGFRGTDVRAGHVRASDATLQGGFALPLETYPPEVWRQFMFEHEKAVAAIGVRPNAVTGPAAQLLYQAVVAERDRRTDGSAAGR
jgi:acetyl esterase/lipase